MEKICREKVAEWNFYFTVTQKDYGKLFHINSLLRASLVWLAIENLQLFGATELKENKKS